MTAELHSYDFWFHSTANPLYTNMWHQTITAEPAFIRQIVTEFCIEHEGDLDSYGFLHKVKSEFICPELDDSIEWEDSEAQFRKGELGFYFHFHKQELSDSEVIHHFMEELESKISRAKEKRSLPTT